MPERIQAAEDVLSQRNREFDLDHGGTPEERLAIADAMRGLAVLRNDVVKWCATPKSQSAHGKNLS
jgi:hypothetical protein